MRFALVRFVDLLVEALIVLISQVTCFLVNHLVSNYEFCA